MENDKGLLLQFCFLPLILSTLSLSLFLPFWGDVFRYRYVTDLPATHGYTTTWMAYQTVEAISKK